MKSSVRAILHPTDFSPSSVGAFAHALKIALATKSKLYILHVLQNDVGEGWEFPDVRLRRLLMQWNLLKANDALETIDIKLGVQIEKITFHRDKTPVDEIVHFLKQQVCDLVVLATHGRDGLEYWRDGSIAETAFRQSAIPTLFIRQGARGFVDQVSGDINLRRILVPVDHSPLPHRAIEAARDLSHLVTGVDAAMDFLHVGLMAPAIGRLKSAVILRPGNVVQTIVDAAVEYDVDLICMPTAGHHGILDALRGSTTERVMRHAPCPLLAVSVA